MACRHFTTGGSEPRAYWAPPRPVGRSSPATPSPLEVAVAPRGDRPDPPPWRHSPVVGGASHPRDRLLLAVVDLVTAIQDTDLPPAAVLGRPDPGKHGRGAGPVPAPSPRAGRRAAWTNPTGSVIYRTRSGGAVRIGAAGGATPTQRHRGRGTGWYRGPPPRRRHARPSPGVWWPSALPVRLCLYGGTTKGPTT